MNTLRKSPRKMKETTWTTNQISWNSLRPLSPHLPSCKPQFTSTFPISHRISGAFLVTIVLFFYLYSICLIFFSLSFFQALLSKIGFSLGGRALSFFLICVGWEGGFLLAIIISLLSGVDGNAVSPGGTPSPSPSSSQNSFPSLSGEMTRQSFFQQPKDGFQNQDEIW